MTVKTIKISELNREDLELVARTNCVPFSVDDSNDAIIARIYKITGKRRKAINVNSVVSDETRKKAREGLEKFSNYVKKAAEQYGGQPA